MLSASHKGDWQVLSATSVDRAARDVTAWGKVTKSVLSPSLLASGSTQGSNNFKKYLLNSYYRQTAEDMIRNKKKT